MSFKAYTLEVASSFTLYTTPKAPLPSRFSILSILVPSCTLEEFCIVSVRWNRVRISRERSKLATGHGSFSVLPRAS